MNKCEPVPVGDRDVHRRRGVADHALRVVPERIVHRERPANCFPRVLADDERGLVIHRLGEERGARLGLGYGQTRE